MHKSSFCFVSLLLPILFLVSCGDTAETNSSLKEMVSKETVSLRFVQHTFIRFSFDSNGDQNGYYFQNDELSETILKYKKGYFLTEDDIQSYNSNTLNYTIPPLNGDGYWSFTSFMLDFDESSGLATDFLEPVQVDKDYVIHFGIYG